MSDYEQDISDVESDFSDYDIDYAGGADASEEEVLVAPEDPDEGADEESEADFYESEADVAENEEDDYDNYEEEPVDLKKVSNHNKEIIVIKPENRRTSNVMSKFEMTEHNSIRATQIAQYNNCMVDITGLDDPVKMAKRELMMRKSPLVLRRHVGERKNGKGEWESFYEYWSPNEMTFSTVYSDVL